MKQRIKLTILLLAIISYGLMLRTVNIGLARSWLDELDAIKYAQIHSGWESMKHWGQPPLHYVMLNELSFGGETLMRWSSVILSVLTIIPAFFLGKIIFKRNRYGMLVAFIMASNQLLIYYSQEIRMYSLETLLSVISWWLFFRQLENKGLSNLFWLTCVNFLLINTHTLAMVMMVLQIGWLIFWRPKSSIHHKVFRVESLAYVLLFLFFASVYLPTLISYDKTITKAAVSWLELLHPFDPHTQFWPLVRLWRHLSGVEYGKVELVVFGFVFLWSGLVGKVRWISWLIFVAYATSMATIHVSLTFKVLHLFATRYLIFLTPVFALALPSVCINVRKKWGRKKEVVSILIVVIFFLRMSLEYLLTNPTHYDDMP